MCFNLATVELTSLVASAGNTGEFSVDNMDKRILKGNIICFMLKVFNLM